MLHTRLEPVKQENTLNGRGGLSRGVLLGPTSSSDGNPSL